MQTSCLLVPNEITAMNIHLGKEETTLVRKTSLTRSLSLVTSMASAGLLIAGLDGLLDFMRFHGNAEVVYQGSRQRYNIFLLQKNQKLLEMKLN